MAFNFHIVPLCAVDDADDDDDDGDDDVPNYVENLIVIKLILDTAASVSLSSQTSEFD